MLFELRHVLDSSLRSALFSEESESDNIQLNGVGQNDILLGTLNMRLLLRFCERGLDP